MLETLYKTATPEAYVWDGEYYTLFLSSPTASSSGYKLTEKHGWWDDVQKKPISNTTTLSPEDGFATFEEGEAAFNQQKMHRARGDFVHSFAPDPFEQPHVYRLIELT
jgi:hypothetical protein